MICFANIDAYIFVQFMKKVNGRKNIKNTVFFLNRGFMYCIQFCIFVILSPASVSYLTTCTLQQKTCSTAFSSHSLRIMVYGEVNSVKNTTINIRLNDCIY